MTTDVLVVGGGSWSQQLSSELLQRLPVRCERANTDVGIRRYLQGHARAVCLLLCPTLEVDATLVRLRLLRSLHPQTPRILLVEKSSEQLAIAALRNGANEYLVWPMQAEDILSVIARLSPAPPPETDPESKLVGRSTILRDAITRLKRLAAADCPVLITGETGTGKELAAQMLHAESSRAQYPMVSLNCAAIPETLLESELFGHERGAFTGAHTSRAGALADAHRGTVLLDEIGDMDLSSQAKILRAVETRSIQRLGSSRPIPIDVRLVASTHHDLSERVMQGRFRQDLYYRLQVARVHMPPLRERPEDVSVLVDHYVAQLKSKYPGRSCIVRKDLLRILQGHAWPGNVRELRNLIESIYVFCDGPELTPADLPADYKKLLDGNETSAERDRLLYVLRSTDWNKAEAARKLHCSRMTLYRKLAKYELRPDLPHTRAAQA